MSLCFFLTGLCFMSPPPLHSRLSYGALHLAEQRHHLLTYAADEGDA